MNKPSSKRIFLSPPHMGGEELEFIKEAFESNYIAPLGPQVDAFEREFAEYTGIEHCVALSSGTAALHLALRCLLRDQHETWGIAPGETPSVFASALTFIGSVTPIVFQGATPVFIDCDRTSWNMDTDLLEEELERCDRMGRLPKAVVPTDLYGQCCQLPRILKICSNFGIPVVCDSAEAVGAKYDARSEQRAESSEQRAKHEIRKTDLRPLTSDLWRHAGVGAKAAVFSFNGNKIITTSGGGMLASDDEELIEHARFLSQQARDPFLHYEHSEIGYNYRMSNVLAAIGRGQLRVLDERVRRKREIFDSYKKGLEDIPGIEFMPEAPYGRSNRWLTVILITPEAFGTDREKVRLALEAENIEARPVWKPMHIQPVFQVEAHGAESKVQSGRQRVPSRTVGGTSRGQRPEVTPVEHPGREPGSTGHGGRDGKKQYPCRVVGGQVAPQLNTLKGPGSTPVRSAGPTGQAGQGGLSNNNKKSYPDRAIGGNVAEDLFNRGLCLPSGTAMTEDDLNRVVSVIRKCYRGVRIN